MTATLPLATPIGWDPVSPHPYGPGVSGQPTLFDEQLSGHGTAGRPGPDPEVTTRARKFAVVTVEVLAGRRPPAQLARWTTETVQARLTMTAHRNRGRLPLRVASVHCQAPAADAVEATLRIVTGTRSVAMAFRLQRRGRRWLCTAWDLRPEDLEGP